MRKLQSFGSGGVVTKVGSYFACTELATGVCQLVRVREMVQVFRTDSVCIRVSVDAAPMPSAPEGVWGVIDTDLLCGPVMVAVECVSMCGLHVVQDEGQLKYRYL